LSRIRRRLRELHCIGLSTFYGDSLADRRFWHFRRWYDQGTRGGRGYRAVMVSLVGEDTAQETYPWYQCQIKLPQELAVLSLLVSDAR
jgi:hypothetical protein